MKRFLMLLLAVLALGTTLSALAAAEPSPTPVGQHRSGQHQGG